MFQVSNFKGTSQQTSPLAASHHNKTLGMVAIDILRFHPQQLESNIFLWHKVISPSAILHVPCLIREQIELHIALKDNVFALVQSYILIKVETLRAIF